MTCSKPDLATPQSRVLAVPRPYDLRQSMGDQRMGGGDPTLRLSGRVLEIAVPTPEGPASLRAEIHKDETRTRTWGPGAEWLSTRTGELLGFSDDTEDFRPPEGPARRLWRKAPGVRLPRFPSIYVRTLQAVVQQLVSSREAFRSWRALTLAVGSPAPGPLELRLPPDPEVVQTTPGHVFSACGIPLRRARVMRDVARVAVRLERAASLGWPMLEPELLRIRGVGPWTAEYVRGSAMADPDAVVLGDYNLPHTVSWALAGEPRGTDQRMIELLEPFRGHRYRVVRLIHAAGAQAPRRGHRLPLRTRGR